MAGAGIYFARYHIMKKLKNVIIAVPVSSNLSKLDPKMATSAMKA